MIDLGWLGYIEFSWKFFLAVGSIVLIDLVLAGDNAVVIAMAVKNLHGKKRHLGHHPRLRRRRSSSESPAPSWSPNCSTCSMSSWSAAP